MNAEGNEVRVPFRIVLGDANILYSRVVRDYLLYAMTRRIIRVHRSAALLHETVEHLSQNIDGFTVESGRRLVAAMNGTFPNSEVAPTIEDRKAVAELTLRTKTTVRCSLLRLQPRPTFCARITSSTSHLRRWRRSASRP